MPYDFNTAINPGRPGEVGPYGSAFPHAGMSVQELVALTMGQQGYMRQQQQQSADALGASPGALLGLLRGGVNPGMAQGAVGQMAGAQRGPAQTQPDPMLDVMAAQNFQRESDFMTQEAVLDYLAANQPGFMEKFGPVLMTLAGMATGGLAAAPLAAGGMGAAAGAGLGGTVGSTLAQLLSSRY